MRNSGVRGKAKKSALHGADSALGPQGRAGPCEKHRAAIASSLRVRGRPSGEDLGTLAHVHKNVCIMHKDCSILAMCRSFLQSIQCVENGIGVACVIDQSLRVLPLSRDVSLTTISSPRPFRNCLMAAYPAEVGERDRQNDPCRMHQQS